MRHRTRICSVDECAGTNLAFSIAGLVSDNQFSLEFSSLGGGRRRQDAPSPQSFADLAIELDSPAFLLQNDFDDGVTGFHVTTTPERAREALRGGTLLAAALQVADQKDESIQPYLLEFAGLLRFFTNDGDARRWMVEGVLYAASYHMRRGDVARAMNVVEQGASAFPGDPRLSTASAYLRLARQQQPPQSAVPAITEIKCWSLDVLRGVVALKAGAFWDASAFFERAADNLGPDSDKRRLFILRAASAFLAAMTRGNPARRGTRIVVNAERAGAAYPGVQLVELLRAFGMTLRGNRAASGELFDKLGEAASNESERATLRFWHALALAETGREAQASRMLAERAEYGATDAPTLGLLAQLMHNAAADAQSVEASLKIARKALEKDSGEVRSNRLLGLHKAREAESLPRGLRRALKEEALAHLERCVAGGGGDSEIYSEIGVIYRDLARAIPARNARRQALELMCSLDGSPIACAVVEIRDLLESSIPNRMNASAVRTNELLQWLMDNPAAVKPIDRDNMLIEAAIAWYERGDVNRSQMLYENVLSNLRTYADQLQRRFLDSWVTCNLGFIYVDKAMTVEAVQAFRHSMQLEYSPDCQAGLAIALKQAGQDAEALAQYQQAKAVDANYAGEIEVLRDTNSWSDTACKYLQALDAADTNSQKSAREGANK
jgi:tetratricopeptide (TPR) repeat protein